MTEQRRPPIHQLVSKGDSALSRGDFAFAYESYTEAIQLLSAGVTPITSGDEAEYQFAEVGFLMMRRGFSLLGDGQFVASFLDLAMSATLGPDAVTPLCAMSSVRATCILPTVYDPHLAHVLANSANWYATDSKQRALTQLTQGLVLTSLGKWQSAQALLLQIPEDDRSTLADYNSYLAAAHGRVPIRRSPEDFARRIVQLFQDSEVR